MQSDPETWAAFIELTHHHGIHVQSMEMLLLDSDTPTMVHLLCRPLANGQVLQHPLPPDWKPERILRYRTVLELCRFFRIPMLKKWPLTM